MCIKENSTIVYMKLLCKAQGSSILLVHVGGVMEYRNVSYIGTGHLMVYTITLISP